MPPSNDERAELTFARFQAAKLATLLKACSEHPTGVIQGAP